MASTESKQRTENNELDTLPEALVYLRNKLGWTQQQLAWSLGVALRTIIRWEQGDSAIGYENVLKLLALAKLHDHAEVIPRFIDGCPHEMQRLIDLESFLRDPNWVPPDPYSSAKNKAAVRRNQKRIKVSRNEALVQQKMMSFGKFLMEQLNAQDKGILELDNGQQQAARNAMVEVGTRITERVLNEFYLTEQDKERLRRKAPKVFLKNESGQP